MKDKMYIFLQSVIQRSDKRSHISFASLGRGGWRIQLKIELGDQLGGLSIEG